MLGELSGTALPILLNRAHGWKSEDRRQKGLVWEGVEAGSQCAPSSLCGRVSSDTGSVYVDHEIVSCQCEKEVLGSFVPPSLSILHSPPHTLHPSLLVDAHV